MYRGFNGMGYGYGYSGFPWGTLAIGLGFVVIVAGIVYISVKLGKGGSLRGAKEGGEVATPMQDIPDLEAHRASISQASVKGLEILAERFARGELDSETYQAMKMEILG